MNDPRRAYQHGYKVSDVCRLINRIPSEAMARMLGRGDATALELAPSGAWPATESDVLYCLHRDGLVEWAGCHRQHGSTLWAAYRLTERGEEVFGLLIKIEEHIAQGRQERQSHAEA